MAPKRPIGPATSNQTGVFGQTSAVNPASFESLPDGLLDAHCHLGFCENGPEIAAAGAAQGISFLSCTVRPEDYQRDEARFADYPNVQVGLGFHPWWVQGVPESPCERSASPGVEVSSTPDGPAKSAGLASPLSIADERQLMIFKDKLPQAAFVGEIGLDFGKVHGATEAAQRVVFSRIVELCVQEAQRRAEPLALSVHAVRSAGAVLDVLEDAGCFGPFANIQVILHWFSGTSDELQRALRLGCRFSVGERMLAAKRGRSYVQAIRVAAGPAFRLLLETDFPPEGGPDELVTCDPETWLASLRHAANETGLPQQHRGS